MFSAGNLLSEIFRWKNEITQQVKRHTDLSVQHLNSKLLVQGIPPPPWLLEDVRCSEAPRVVHKEDFISKLLRQHQQSVSFVPQARCSLYSKPFGEGDGEKAGGIVAETHSSQECFDGGSEQGAESGCGEDNPRCDVDAAPDVDVDVTNQQEPTMCSPGTCCSPGNKPVKEGVEGVEAETHSNHECFDSGKGHGVESACVEDNPRCNMDAVPDLDVDVTAQQEPTLHSPGTCCSPYNKAIQEGDEGVVEGAIIAEIHSNHECYDSGNESDCVEKNPRCDMDAVPDIDFDVSAQQEPTIHSPGTCCSPYNKPGWEGDEGVLAGGIIAETHSDHECFDSGNYHGVGSGHVEHNPGCDISVAPVSDTSVMVHQQSEIGSPSACCLPINNSAGKGDEGVQESGELKEQDTYSNNGHQQGPASDSIKHNTAGNWNTEPDVDSNAVSPHDIEVRISSIFNAPDQSVARIQRSKSRQKALELRNSAKTQSRIRLKSRLFVCSPAKDQATETKRLGSPGILNRENCEAWEMQVGDNECNNKKRSFNSCTGEFSGSKGCQKLPISEMDLVKGDSSACMSEKNQSTALRDAEDFQQCSEVPNLLQEAIYSCVNSEHNSLFVTVSPEKNPATCGYGSSPTTFLDEAPERDIADGFGVVDEDLVAKSPGKSVQQFDDTNEHSMEFVHGEVRSVTKSGDEGMTEFLDTSISAGHASTKSISGTADEALNRSDGQVILASIDSHISAKQLGNFEIIAGDLLESIPCGAGLEYSPTRRSSGYSMFLEPKQLDFDEREKCSIKDKSTVSVEFDQLERSTVKVLDAPLHLPSTSDHVTVSGETDPRKISILERGFLPEAVEISASPSDTNIKEHDELQLEARGSTLYEHSVPENIEVDTDPYVSNSELSCLVDISQPKVTVEDPGSEKHAKTSFGEVYGPELQDEDGITDEETNSASYSFKSKHCMGTNIPSSAERSVGGCRLQEVGTSGPNILVGIQGQNCVEDNHYPLNLASESCPNSEYSTQQVLDSSTLGGNDLLARGSDGSPFSSLLESMGLRVSKDSVAQNLRSLEVDSWPRSKRIKIQDKETVCFSTSPSFRVKKQPPSRINSMSVRKVGEDTETSLGVASSAEKSIQKEEHEDMVLLASKTMEVKPRMHVQKLALTSENFGEHADTTSPSSLNQVGKTVFSLTDIVARCSEETKLAGTSADRTEDSDQEDHLHRINLESIGNLATSKDLMAVRSHLHRKSFSGMDLTFSDQTMPDLEGFLIHQPIEHEVVKTSGHAINFAELELLRTSLERASILEQLCASTISHTPSTKFPSSLKLNESNKTCQSVPNGFLECKDLRNISAFNADVPKQLKVSCMSNTSDHLLQKMSHSDSLVDLGARLSWSSRELPRSPIGKLWERMSLQTGSSGKRLSSNPELTCFRIEEDPSSSEENENALEVAEKPQEDDHSIADSGAKRQPLANITNIIAQPPIFAVKKSVDRASMDSISTEVSFKGTYKKMRPKVPSFCRNNDGDDKEDDSLAVTASTIKNKRELTASNIRKRGLPRETSLRREMLRSEKKLKHSNIVSNVTSFVPLVKQKQAAVICAGKKDVKVKALEIAEAAKRLEEKKDNERKMRKEALKLERAKTEQENLRQMELDKKRKEEERKKKDADVAARKRQREEEDKKERERKRKRLEETQRMRKEGGTQKAEKQKQTRDHDEKDVKTKEPDNRLQKKHDLVKSIHVEESKEFKFQAGVSVEACATSGDFSRHMKESTSLDRTGPTGNMRVQESEDKSYDISPYHCSDEEDEEEIEEERNKKFIPPWASSKCVALVLPSQQRVHYELIFPAESFCSANEACTSSKARRTSKTKV